MRSKFTPSSERNGRELVQSSLYDDYRRRVVVQLVDKSSIGKVTHPRLNPTFRIKGQSVVLHPFGDRFGWQRESWRVRPVVAGRGWRDYCGPR
jgi:hypothetical protein